MHVLYVNHPLRVIIRKTWEVFYTAKSSLRDGLLIFQNLEITWSGNIFRLGQQINLENPKNVNFNLFKDHHFRVNLKNLGIRRPTSYIFDQALIHWIYLCHEKLKNFDYFFHAQRIQQFIPGVHRTNRFYCRKYDKFMIVRHCLLEGFNNIGASTGIYTLKVFVLCFQFYLFPNYD